MVFKEGTTLRIRNVSNSIGILGQEGVRTSGLEDISCCCWRAAGPQDTFGAF